MHVEAGNDWGASLERQLFLCKKALKRHRGPEIRAKELQVKNIPEETWEKRCEEKGNFVRPAWVYGLAVVWMLRAGEVADLKMGDVDVCFQSKLVVLSIRKSKTDQAAKGVKRTLKCCSREECERICPFSLTVRILAERVNAKANEALFKTIGRVKRDRSHVSKWWAKTLDPQLTGHSARRTGAMMYTRMGLQLADLAFLGRWRSSAVFRYMEEAMQERPMNTMVPKEVLLQEMQSPTQALENLVNKSKNEKTLQENQSIERAEETRIAKQEDPQETTLWATSWRQGNRTSHRVVRAAWGLDLNQWTTACGWHFAQRFVKVTLSKGPSPKAKICRKCQTYSEMRDRVPEGRDVAQVLTRELVL
eukprot:Skav200730  [mRNA]  locus=scaffold274:57547:58635:+ [translate_table: standard]